MRYCLPSFALVLSLTAVGTSLSCPFCSAPALTLTEQFADSDIVALVKWKDGKQATDTDPGSSRFEVVKIPTNKGVKIKADEVLTLPRYRAAKEGDLFVLMGTQNETLEWNTTIPVTAESYKYMSNAPSPDLPTVRRLEYYLDYLEHTDEMVAMDAYGEFANAPYKDITPLRARLPREKISKWALDPNTSPTRVSLYGLLLGLCGNDEDAKAMEAIITKQTVKYRLGLDSMISGYLLIRGAKGLDVIDRAKLANRVVNGVEVPFSETYAVVGAIRFMWTYAPEVIPKSRLKESMRLLLNRPAVVDLVIPDLARWKDWEICERLYNMYGEDKYDQRAIKLSIVKFLIHCSRDVPKPDKDKDKVAKTDGEPDADAAATDEVVVELPKHVIEAKKFLELIKARDPKTVRDAKRTII